MARSTYQPMTEFQNLKLCVLVEPKRFGIWGMMKANLREAWGSWVTVTVTVTVPATNNTVTVTAMVTVTVPATNYTVTFTVTVTQLPVTLTGN
jgi:hypothetical protein